VGELPDRDATDMLVEAVRKAGSTRTPLRIVGADTKRFYGRPVEAERLDLSVHRGVIRYDPAELVVTARAGTPLADINALLERHGQCLPFEPPAFGARATLGGTIAAGLAGPARAARGPVRDYVLGARLLTGDGRVLHFGGEVMKNVAGYDVSRLLAGSLGILGAILDVSLKVLPRSTAALTLRMGVDAGEALAQLQRCARSGMPLTAGFWCDGMLSLRFEASPPSLETIAASVPGERVPAADAQVLWTDVREQHHRFFARTDTNLWRYWVPPTSPVCGWPVERLALEWNGAQRWITGDPCDDADGVARGVRTLFRSDVRGCRVDEVFAPLPAPLLRLHHSIKAAFDPQRILNPGRMYRDL
jgi:glycolate oxidase FAD binding subunit